MKRFLLVAALSLFSLTAAAQTPTLSDEDFDTAWTNTHGFAHSCNDAIKDVLDTKGSDEAIDTADQLCSTFLAGAYLVTHSPDTARLERYVKEDPENRLKVIDEMSTVGRNLSALARAVGPARLPRIASVAEYLSGLDEAATIEAEEYL